MNERIKLESGAFLDITMLDFESGLSLFSVISKELLKINVDIGDLNINDLAGSELTNDFLNTIKNTILTLVVSEELRLSLKKAFERCTYNNSKIDNDIFEDVKIRSDYFIVCWEVLKFNLSPFLPKNVSMLLGKVGTNTNIQKQK